MRQSQKGRHTLEMLHNNRRENSCVYVRNLHLWPQFYPLGILRHISVFKPCRLSRYSLDTASFTARTLPSLIFLVCCLRLVGDAQCASQRAMRGMRAMRGRHARHAENARHDARHWQHVRHELSRSRFFFSSLLLGSYAWSTPF